MKARKYRVDLYWSEEDDLYLAEVPELPGCVTHGETVSEAAQNAEEAIEAWIEMAEQMGDPIPEAVVEKHFSGRFVARLPRDLHRRLAEEARRQRVSLNQYLVSRLAESPSRASPLPLVMTAAPDEPLVATVRAYLEEEARGKHKAKTTDQIAHAVGLKPTTENTKVRDAIRRLVLEQQVPVVGSVRGYFIAENPQDIKAAARGLARRKREAEEREHILGLLRDFLELQDEERTRESLLEASEELLRTK